MTSISSEETDFVVGKQASQSERLIGYRRILVLLWAIFLLRAAFYLSFTPIWEGFDEHSHFAYVQLLSTEGRLPVADRDRISEEVRASLKVAPLPWQPRGFGTGLTHDDYWRLSKSERGRLEAGLRTIDVSLGSRQIASEDANSLLYLYEAQHPPLYYALCVIPYRLASQLTLMERVFLIRAFSVLLASAVVPLAFFLLRRFLGDGPALLVVWIFAFLPGLMFDVVRIGNDSLAALLFTLLVLLCVRGVKFRLQAVMIGLILGLGLLTKGSFLTAIVPVGIALLLPRSTDRPLKKRLGDLGLAVLATFVISAWWYLRNYWTTGNWTGLYFTSAINGWSLKEALAVDWLNAFQTILTSHVWFGNWSFLKLRGWMYQLCTVAFLLGVAGAALRAVQAFTRTERDRYPFLVAILFYAFFWMGIGYYTLLTYLATGVSATDGWYLCIAIACEFLVLFTGWAFFSTGWSTRIAAGAALGLTMMDLYGVFFVLIPYYTGFISHNPRGSLASFKPGSLSAADYGELISRLTANKPGFMTTGYFLGSGILFLLLGVASAVIAAGLIWRGATPAARTYGRENE